MLTNFLLGLPTMVLSLLLQIILLVVAIRYYYRKYYIMHHVSFLSSLVIISSIMLLLVIGNLGQIALWALLFLLLDEFQLFSVAFYHSAVNFASLGYGDIVMSEKYRLLGALEAINGVLMIGLSTAALMSTFQNETKKLQAERNKPTDNTK
ncbi:MAG: ion channel [Acidiferrobacterales bacterium]